VWLIALCFVYQKLLHFTPSWSGLLLSAESEFLETGELSQQVSRVAPSKNCITIFSTRLRHCYWPLSTGTRTPRGYDKGLWSLSVFFATFFKYTRSLLLRCKKASPQPFAPFRKIVLRQISAWPTSWPILVLKIVVVFQSVWFKRTENNYSNIFLQVLWK